MERRSATYTEAVRDLQLKDDEFEDTYNFIAEFANITQTRNYASTEFSGDECFESYGSGKFDFSELQAKFKTICNDYMDPVEMGTKSQAVDFCSRMIYEVGPDSRKGNRTENKMYEMKFGYNVDNKLVVRTCIVATYRGIDYKEEYIPGERLCLTVKRASMLAVVTMCQLIDLDKKLYLLTPLASACFGKNVICEIAAELGITEQQVLKDINVGCQSGSQHIPGGSLHIALVNTIVATRGLSSDKTRESIMKIIKQFHRAKKTLDKRLFKIYYKFSYASLVPRIEDLIRQFDSIQSMTTRAVATASAASTLSSNVSVPGTHPATTQPPPSTSKGSTQLP